MCICVNVLRACVHVCVWGGGGGGGGRKKKRQEVKKQVLYVFPQLDAALEYSHTNICLRWSPS